MHIRVGDEGGSASVSGRLTTAAARSDVNCASRPGLLFSVVDVTRQVPSPSASGWLFDASEYRGPRFVVLRLDEDEAYGRLVEHLRELGVASDDAEAAAILEGATIDFIGVLR